MKIAYPSFDTEVTSRDVLMCLCTLLGTPAGTVPLDREFGLDTRKILDLPMARARNAYALEVISKVRRYEPRVKITKVDFTVSAVSGDLYPHLQIAWADDFTYDSSKEGDMAMYTFWDQPDTAEDGEVFMGPYNVVPKWQDQSIDTTNRKLTKPVTVKAIPYHDVTNETGTGMVIGEE